MMALIAPARALLHSEYDGFGLAEYVDHGDDGCAGRFAGINFERARRISLAVREDGSVPEAGARRKTGSIGIGDVVVRGVFVVVDAGRQSAPARRQLEL